MAMAAINPLGYFLFVHNGIVVDPLSIISTLPVTCVFWARRPPPSFFFFLSFSFLFCPLPTADCIFSVMINKFAGSHGGGGGKSDTGKSAELFFVCVCALIRLEKKKKSSSSVVAGSWKR